MSCLPEEAGGPELIMGGASAFHRPGGDTSAPLASSLLQDVQRKPKTMKLSVLDFPQDSTRVATLNEKSQDV